jgi:hypothetical protein
MSWSIGFDEHWNRDIGYGVPSICDAPGCDTEITRGLSFVCGSDPYGGEHGCGLYFCHAHLFYRTPRGSDRAIQNCPRCIAYKPPYQKSKPDTPEWNHHKLTHESWAKWRADEPDEVERLWERLNESPFDTGEE